MYRTRPGTDLNPPLTAAPPTPAYPVRADRLYGRRAECHALDRLVADVRAGQSRALIIRGEAGPARPRCWISWLMRPPGVWSCV